MTPAESRFANHLFAGPWTDPAIEAQEGYARDHFHVLIDRDTPPADIPGNVWRGLERLTWQMWRAFSALQAHRDRLSTLR